MGTRMIITRQRGGDQDGRIGEYFVWKQWFHCLTCTPSAITTPQETHLLGERLDML